MSGDVVFHAKDPTLLVLAENKTGYLGVSLTHPGHDLTI